MFQDILEEQQSPQGVVHKQHVCIFKMGFGSKFFENHAIVAMESDNVTFYPCKIIKKVYIRLQFEENNFFPQVAPTSTKQLKYFLNTNNSTI